MNALFLNVLNMSIAASWIVLAILLLRLLLKKAPKWINVLLWGIVAVRLVCPFSIESVLSLIPSAETIPSNIGSSSAPSINTGVPIVNDMVNPIITDNFTPAATNISPLQIVISVLAVAWMIGAVGMLAYTAISYIRVRNRVKTAVLLNDNIYQCETVGSPFVLGIIKPKIYLPFHIGESEMAYVIAHEQAHIRRRDHLWKPFGFLVLTLHWFNPLVWLGYILLCRDIELACDEKVVKELGAEARADYSEALLACSVNRRMIAACPLAFGEVGVKQRIKSVLNYKKPAFWIVIVAIIATIAASVCLLTNPPAKDENNGSLLFALTGTNDVNQINDFKITHEYGGVSATITDKNDLKFLEKYRYSHLYPTNQLQELFVFPGNLRITINSGSINVHELYLMQDGSIVVERTAQTNGTTQTTYDVYTADGDALLDEAALIALLKKYGGYTDTTSPTVTAAEIEALKTKYPMYFDLSTHKGLLVYIWQMAPNSFHCGLLPGRNLGYTQEELIGHFTKGTSIEEMRAIVASYYPSNAKEYVSVLPYVNPISSYAYTIDEAYQIALNEFFWASFPTLSDNDFIIVDRTTSEELSVGMAFEEFYRDDHDIYRFSCVKSQYVEVRYADGTVESIKDALKSGRVKITDLDRFGITYEKTKLTDIDT